MSDFLKQMATLSAERAAAARRRYRDDELDAPVFGIRLGGFDIIAELKDSSPSEGVIASSGQDRLEQAAHYARGGAAAVSVLTEPTTFGGSVGHLRDTAAALAPLGVPAMRKDFLVEAVQVLEARAAGASGVLLIATMLDDTQLAAMLDCAYEQKMFVLLESFDEDDLKRSSQLLEDPLHRDAAHRGRLLFGVNSRNLRTLAVDARRLDRLSPLLPPDVACVAESGLETAQDAAHAAGLGYRLALVGTALMRHDDPQALLRDMLDAGRARCAA